MDVEIEKIFQDIKTSQYLARTFTSSSQGRLRRDTELIGSTVAAITLYFYEWFLVFKDEIELLGPLRFSKGKTLYYFVGDLSS